MSNKSLNILIIEDNIDLANIMCEILGLLGHNASAANNGSEGIAKAKELSPNVIICDIGLPDMSGYELAKIIRKNPSLKDTYLIAASGYAQPEYVERSKEAGFNIHLAKPVEFATLEMVLKEVK